MKRWSLKYSTTKTYRSSLNYPSYTILCEWCECPLGHQREKERDCQSCNTWIKKHKFDCKIYKEIKLISQKTWVEYSSILPRH